MKTPKHATKCFIGAFHNREIDPYLQAIGFTRGMISFAIPSLGILFKCRAGGSLIDMEFAALFSLLEFIKTRLPEENVRDVLVLSSNPEFVFSFTGQSRHLQEGTQNRKLLDEFTSRIKMAVGYIKNIENNALASPADYPSVPNPQKVIIQPSRDESDKTEFKPFMRGIRL